MSFENNVAESECVRFEVTLNGVSFTEITVRSGNYIVTIHSADNENYPSAIYFISKSSVERNGIIRKISDTPGLNTFEQLDLHWPTGDILYLRKTDQGCNGVYIIDINRKNLSPTEEYVDNVIQQLLNVSIPVDN